jgi:hypothetical protein
LALAREGYGWADINAADLWDMARFLGFWKVVATNWRSGLREIRNSLFRKSYLAQCRKYCPELTLDDLQPHPAGIRAQAVMRDGSLADDFLVRRGRRTLHVCNAPSPAATSAIPIGRHLVNTFHATFGLITPMLSKILGTAQPLLRARQVERSHQLHSCTRRVVRSNRLTPSTSSIRLMVRVKAGCDVFRKAAAAMKLP